MINRAPIRRVCLTINDQHCELNAEQLAELNSWLHDTIERVDQINISAGRGAFVERDKARGEIYAGASGGNFTLIVTPTSIGTVFKVAESITGQTIDLSDYDNW